MEELGKSINNLSLWEVKSYVRKAQNAVLNLSEMESKVREATNNEPWGVSTTKMNEIAQGTYNYREREEIATMIFRRFTEKAANEWRQIYKALQLLEYLIKHGSERFVDDARANVSLINMLKSFHYIDSKGKDQGINVRNRAKSLAALLMDESEIRAERKKARKTTKKFGGVSSAGYGGASSVMPGRFSSSNGITADEVEGNRVYGDGGFYGEVYENPNGSGGSNSQFEEYDVEQPPKPARKSTSRASKPTTSTTKATTNSNNEVDLFSMETKKPEVDDDDDDEFDDFQSAAPSAQTTPAPLNSKSLAGLFSNVAQNHPQPAVPAVPAGAFSGFQATSFQSTPTFQATPSFQATSTTFSQPPAAQPVSRKKNDAFSDLFSSAKATTVKPSATASPKITSPPPPAPPKQEKNDDFADFTAGSTSNTKNNNGEIDLLSF